MDTDTGEPFRLGIEDRDWFGVAHTGDEIASLANVIDHRFWCVTLLGERCSDRRWLHCGQISSTHLPTSKKAKLIRRTSGLQCS
ncbi:MAG: hypothetical protein JOZ19_04820 [Rubrobacter sp.]|nr:hypothetical protein [Rubrobacter sp.]